MTETCVYITEAYFHKPEFTHRSTHQAANNEDKSTSLRQGVSGYHC